MYLSQLILNPRDRNARKDLADCQQLHRTLMRAFPDGLDGPARQQLGVLYRIESDRQSGVVGVLVQSRVAPHWTQLPPLYLLDAPGQENPKCKEIGSFYAAVSGDMELIFRLRANPTRRVKHETGNDGKNWDGKRVHLRGDDAQIEWLRRKAADGGFELLDVSLDNGTPDVRAQEGLDVTGRRSSEPLRPRMTFGSVLFDGRLRVTDAERFRETLEIGVGPAKAYGFGLLSIAPVRGYADAE